MADISFKKGDPIRVIDRQGDDQKYCSVRGAGGSPRLPVCQVVEDAAVYAMKISPDDRAKLVSLMEKSPPQLPDMPPGRLLPFYRVVAAMHYMATLGERVLTLKEAYFIVTTIEADQQNRVDDIFRVKALVNALLGLKLTASEEAYVSKRAPALANAKKPMGPADYVDEGTFKGGGDDGGGDDKKKGGGGGVVAALGIAGAIAFAVLKGR